MPKMRPRTKHINVKYHHFRYHVRRGKVSIRKVKTKDQLADCFTKMCATDLFRKFRLAFMGWDTDSGVARTKGSETFSDKSGVQAQLKTQGVTQSKIQTKTNLQERRNTELAKTYAQTYDRTYDPTNPSSPVVPSITQFKMKNIRMARDVVRKGTVKRHIMKNASENKDTIKRESLRSSHDQLPK